MRFAKTTAVAVALAVGGLTAPISSSLTATDAVAEQRVVRKHVEVRPNGNRIVTKRIVTRRPGVRVVDGRYFYGGRYYDQNEALAAGLIGFAAGAILGGALAQPTVVAPYGQPAVIPY
jgi:anti-sigma factor RsiW